MFERLIVVDCRAHLMGRLASTIAKELLAGQRVVAVRCEELEISGPIWRNQIKLAQKRNKKMNSNHERGPFALRAPAALLKRMVRGMLPHKTQRGQAALNRFRAFEGMPHPYDRMKRMVIPEALRVIRLRPGRKFTNLGVLSAKNGWKHADLLKTLEERRKARNSVWFEKKMKEVKLRQKAAAEADFPAEVKETLAKYGH